MHRKKMPPREAAVTSSNPILSEALRRNGRGKPCNKRPCKGFEESRNCGGK